MLALRMGASVRRLFGILTLSLVLLAAPGCDLIFRAVIGPVPEPDPIYDYSVRSDGCLAGNPPVLQLANCVAAKARVTAYLKGFLPASPDNLKEKLEKMEFTCRNAVNSVAALTCAYKKSQPIFRDCGPTYAVYVVVNFTSNLPAVKDIDVDVSVQKDLVHPDGRRCVPLF
jgi:hypothetical protein